jgi:hypothetical protein
MKVVQLLPALNEGGVERGVVDLARALALRGDRAIVISSGGVLVKELEKEAIKHYQLPVHRKSIFSILKLIPQLTAIFKKESVDIIHARSRVPAIIAYFAWRRYV